MLRHAHRAATSKICKHGAASVGQGIKVFRRMGIARLGVVVTQIFGHVFHTPQLPEKGHVQSEARRPSPSRPTGCIALCRGAEESNPQTSSKAISKHRRPGAHQDRSANCPMQMHPTCICRATALPADSPLDAPFPARARARATQSFFQRRCQAAPARRRTRRSLEN